MTQWHFPLINPIKRFNLKHYLDHVEEEIQEFKDAVGIEESDKEAVDILHAAETFVRKYFEETGRDFETVRDSIIEKNSMRGYYAD